MKLTNDTGRLEHVTAYSLNVIKKLLLFCNSLQIMVTNDLNEEGD